MRRFKATLPLPESKVTSVFSFRPLSIPCHLEIRLLDQGQICFLCAEDEARDIPIKLQLFQALFGVKAKSLQSGMAEGENSPSPRNRRDSVRIRNSDPEFNRPQPGRTDRKSLAGMSENVKAILAPLLGGKKNHSKVEVDMGRESSSAYEIVDTGSTAMQRYSTVEAYAAVEAPSPSSSATQEGTTGGTVAITTPRWSTSRASDVLRRQEMKGKSEETVDTGARPRSPNDPDYARVDKFLPATKPKMKEYDEYITETAPKLRARVNSILADKSHEAGFERKLPGGELELPKLEPPETPSA